MSDAVRPSIESLLVHREWVRRLAARLAPDASAADDLEQETWLVALKSPPRHGDAARGWLGAVARNLARMRHRGASRRAAHETEAARRRGEPTAEDVVAETEVHARLVRAVLGLDEPYRAAVLFRYFHGLGVAEIAERTGAPAETVKTRLKRALERLRAEMGVELGDDREAWALLVFGTRAGKFTPHAAAGVGAAAAGVGGGIAMAAATKTVVAAAVVALAGAAWWLVPKGEDPPPRPVAEPAATAAVEAPPAPTPAAPKPSREHAPAPAEEKIPPAETAAAPAPAGDVVHGRVLDDETGAPVAKARVSLVWEMARQPGKEPSAVTGDDGTFRVAGAIEGRFGDVLVEADGYAETLVSAPWRDRATGLAKFDAGDIRAFRGTRVTGRVLAADGRSAVPGARLCLSKITGSSSAMWFSRAKDFGASGDDGTFALARVPPAPYSPYTLFAASPGGVGWTTLAASVGKADAAGVEVRLRPGAAVVVTVRDEAGVPQKDVRVLASPRFEPLGPPTTWPADHDMWLAKDSPFAAIFTATTDAAGVARMALLPAGDEGATYDVIARGRGAAWKDGVEVAPGQETAVEIVLTAPKLVACVAGVRVLDPDGKPVEGAALSIVSGPAAWKATTDADGVAVVAREKREEPKGADANRAAAWMAVAKEGFATQRVGVRFVPDDGKPLPTVTLVRPAPIDGRIADQDGKPVAGCYVDLLGQKNAPPPVTTGPDGRFSFPDATAGQWTLRRMPPAPYDQWAYDDGQTVVRGGDRDIVLVMRRLPAGKATLTATLVDADTGAPVSAQEAMLIPSVQDDEPIRTPDPKTGMGDGTVTLPRLRPGRYRLWVRVPDRGPGVATVDVAEGQTEVAVRVRVGESGTLRGRVELGDAGIAMPRMLVPESTEDWTSPQWSRSQADGLQGGARVQPDGTFALRNVVPGRYRVWIDQDGWMGEGFADVPARGEGTAVVTFTRVGKIDFRLAAPSPSSTVQYEVAEGDGPWRVVMRFGGLKGKAAHYAATIRPGRWRWRVTFPAQNLSVSPAAAETAEGEVTVVAGETATVDVPVVAK